MSASKGRVLVLGATSAIARAAAAHLAQRGYDLFLAGRHAETLERNAADLRTRYGVRVDVGIFDATNASTHAAFVAEVDAKADGLMGVVLAFGVLGDQERAKEDFSAAKEVIDANFTGAVSVLTHCASVLEQRGRGFIIGISSVAADRGRQSNYVYGAAKAGLDAFLSGLRNRLHPAGVRVITVKPGFVDTPMTFGKEGMFLVASPEEVGARVVSALDGMQDVVYVPWFWQPIMRVIKSIPEGVFKRLKL